MAINLLKVSETIPCPPLTKLPESHPHVKGIASLRGASLSVIDLSRAIGERPLEDPNGGCLIVTDVSRSKQGLHVQAVSKIVHCLTTDIKPPPFGSGGSRAYITGVTSESTLNAATRSCQAGDRSYFTRTPRWALG